MKGWVPDLFFMLTAAVVIFGALVVTLSRNIVRCAFSLLLTFGGVAALYVFLYADFMAVIQILVYIGGIATLFVFAVFLTKGIESTGFPSGVIARFPALLIAGSTILFLNVALLRAEWPGAGIRSEEMAGIGAVSGTTRTIGDALLGPYLFPFEVVSVFLLAVVVGALALARKELTGKKAEEGEE